MDVKSPYPNAPPHVHNVPNYPGGVPGPYEQQQNQGYSAPPPAYSATAGPAPGFPYPAAQGQVFVQHQAPIVYQQVPQHQYQTHVIRKFYK